MTKKKKNTTKGREEEEEEEEEKEEVAKNVAGDSDSGSWGLRLFRFFTDAYRSFSRVSPFSVDPIKGPNRRVSVINLLRVDLIAGSPVLCFLVFFSFPAPDSTPPFWWTNLNPKFSSISTSFRYYTCRIFPLKNSWTLILIVELFEKTYIS